MKLTNWILAAMAAVVLLSNGCRSKNSVDTGPLEKSFAVAEPASKSAADKAVSAIKSADYSSAMSQLKGLASQAKLTPEQQQAVKDTLSQIQKQITDAATKIGSEGQKAAGDLQKSLPKP
jgi:hypothetical protein